MTMRIHLSRSLIHQHSTQIHVGLFPAHNVDLDKVKLNWQIDKSQRGLGRDRISPQRGRKQQIVQFLLIRWNSIASSLLDGGGTALVVGEKRQTPPLCAVNHLNRILAISVDCPIFHIPPLHPIWESCSSSRRGWEDDGNELRGQRWRNQGRPSFPSLDLGIFFRRTRNTSSHKFLTDKFPFGGGGHRHTRQRRCQIVKLQSSATSSV